MVPTSTVLKTVEPLSSDSCGPGSPRAKRVGRFESLSLRHKWHKNGQFLA